MSERSETNVGLTDLLDGNTRHTERGLSVMQARHEVMRAGQALREAAGCESMTSVRAVTLHAEGQHQPGYVLGKTMVAPGPEIYPAPLWWHLPPNG